MNVSAMNDNGFKSTVQGSGRESARVTPQRIRGCRITIGVSWALMAVAMIGLNQALINEAGPSSIPFFALVASLPILPTLFAYKAWLNPDKYRFLDGPAKLLGGSDEARGSVVALLGTAFFYLAVWGLLGEPLIAPLDAAIVIALCVGTARWKIEDPYHRMLCAMALVACPLLLLLGYALALLLFALWLIAKLLPFALIFAALDSK